MRGEETQTHEGRNSDHTPQGPPEALAPAQE